MAWQESLYSGKATPDESGHCPREDETGDYRRLMASFAANNRNRQPVVRSIHFTTAGFQDAGGIAKWQ